MQQNLLDKVKALGQFFTPAYIAQFIVQRTIGQYLLEESYDSKNDFFILDPSVGEGIFLLMAHDYLVNALGKKSETIIPPEEINSKIIVNHIYGIDIDPTKVEMTRNLLGVPKDTSNIKVFDALLLKPDTTTNKINDKLINWELNFPKTEGKFHIIIGNPPWGADISSIKHELEFLKTATLQMDSWSLFLERSILGLRDNGYLGFLVPNTLLINANFSKIREIILAKCQITHLVNLGDGIFPRVTQPSMIIIVKKKVADKSHQIRVFPKVTGKEKLLLKNNQMKLDDCEFFQCPQLRFQKNPQLEFDIFAGPNTTLIQLMEKDLHTEQKKVILLRTLAKNGRGVEIGRKGRVLQCPKCGIWNPPPRATRKCNNKSCDQFISSNDLHSEIVRDSQENPIYDKPFLAGYHIQRYFTHEHKYINSKCEGINYKSPDLYQSPKLLVRKTGKSMNWVIDYQNRWVSQVVYIFKIRDDLPPKFTTITYEYLLGILNSQLMMKYIHSKFFDPERTDFPHFVQNSIMNLPIRIPSSKELKGLAQKIGKLALELQHKYQELYNQSSLNKKEKKLQEQIKRFEHEIEYHLELLYLIPKDKSYLK